MSIAPPEDENIKKIVESCRYLMERYVYYLDKNRDKATIKEETIISNISEILRYAPLDFVRMLSVDQIVNIIQQVNFAVLPDAEDIIYKLIKSSCENMQFDAFKILCAVNFSNLDFNLGTLLAILSVFSRISTFAKKLYEVNCNSASTIEVDVSAKDERINELYNRISALEKENLSIKVIKGSYFTPIKHKPKDYIENIFQAISHGSLASVQYLYEVEHINMEQTDDNGNTPLLLSILRGRKYIMRYLIENVNANRLAKNNNGRGILHTACANGRFDLAKNLLSAYGMKGQINSVDHFGNTPLHRAAYYGIKPEMIEFLLTQGADKMRRNNNGLTPYDVACAGATNQSNYHQIRDILRP